MADQVTPPSFALQQLGERLLGTWQLSGGANGRSCYEWAEGGHFLIHHVDLFVNRPIRGIEIIGHLHRVGQPRSDEIWSRFYSFTDGLTLDYVFELNGRTLIIWFMQKGSDNSMHAQFSEDNNQFEGGWSWPGGGYKVKATRLS